MPSPPASRLATALLFAAGAAPAQGAVLHWPNAPLSYSSEHWDTRNGLPQNTITDLQAGGDGRLFIATLGGLCTYDGSALQTHRPAAGAPLSNRFLCLHRGNHGELLIGTDNHGILVHTGTTDGDVAFTVDERFPATQIFALAMDDKGRVLAATSSSLLRSNGEGCEDIWPPDAPRPRQLFCARGARLLATSAQGVFEVGDTVRNLAPCDATVLCEYGDRIVVGTRNGLFVLGSAGLDPLQPIGQLERSITALLAASDGALWVGTDTCVVRLDHGSLQGLRPIPPDPMRMERTTRLDRSESVHVLREDAEGGIWIGYERAGLTRLHPAEVLCHGNEAGLPQHELTCVVANGAEELLVGTTSGLFRGRDGRFEPVPGAERERVRTICRAGDGTVWFADEAGLHRLAADGSPLVLANDRLPSGRPRALIAATDGGLWVGGPTGIALVYGDAASVPPALAGASREAVRRLAIAPDGALWWGAAGSLGRLSADRSTARVWRCGEELPHGELRGILPEAGEHAWVAGYGAGIVRVDGDRCVTVGERQGLTATSLCALLPCGEHLLAASNIGLFLVRIADLEAVVAGATPTLASRPLRMIDGPLSECSGGMQPCATEFDGSYWVCGLDGLLEFDPDRLAAPSGRPPARLEGIVLGERAWPALRRVRAIEPVHSATFRLGTTSLDHHDQVRYRWRMLGHAEEWSTPAFEREIHVDDLPPGDLVFEAEAIGIDGSTSSEPLRVELHVPTPWWQSTWLRIFGPLTGVAVGAFLLQSVASRAARRASRLQQIVEERTRELRVAQGQLELRVEERTRELRAALHRQEVEMTERQRLERELQQLRRMESIGQFAGGIAHDFNNLLTVTSGASDLLEDEGLSAEGIELCRNIQQACERGRGLTQHLLAVASRQVVAVAIIDLGAIVRDLVPVLRRLLGEDIELDCSGLDGATPVRGATTQIEQILLNLAANARDAMPRGGTLSIRIWREEHVAHCEIRDTGIGMTQAVVDHAFEPFFSTKNSRGLGRGLGLATVYGITKQLGGDAAIESSPGKGTAVHVTLPLHGDTAAPPTVEPVGTVDGKLDLRVMLIEDEPDVRRVLRKVLERLGCTVVTASGGEEAVGILRDSPGVVDAVVSDVVMPGLQGLALVDALRTVATGMPIVFLSGYLDGRLTHRDLLDIGLDILPKPVDSRKLAGILRRFSGARRHG